MKKRREQSKIPTAPVEAPRVNARPWLITLIAIQFLLGLVYWYCTPFGASPDEGPHGKYIQALVDTHSFPVFDVNDRVNYESHQPPLYYVLGVPFYLAGRAAGLPDPASAARLLSLILGAASVLVIYLALARLLPNAKYLALAAAGFAGLLPTHVMMSSSVGNDGLTELLFGLALLLVIRQMLDGLTWRRTILLGGVLGLGVLTKTTCLLIYPIVGLAYLFVAQRKSVSWSHLAIHCAAMLGISLAAGGWWLLRNQMLYGDPLVMSKFQKAFEHTARPEFFFQRGLDLGGYLTLVAYLTFRSFWGVFGQMDVFMPDVIYPVLGVLSVGMTIAAVIALRRMKSEPQALRDVLFVFATAIALTVLSFLKFNMMFFQAQGRYLYPALLPMSLFWALGAPVMLPRRWRHLSWIPAVLVPAIAQVVALAWCIIPRMPTYHM